MRGKATFEAMDGILGTHRDCLADVAMLRAQPELFGSAASDPVVSRLVGDAPRALKAIRCARGAARQRAWDLGGVVALAITAHSLTKVPRGMRYIQPGGRPRRQEFPRTFVCAQQPGSDVTGPGIIPTPLPSGVSTDAGR
jgi:hypothetical protein